MSAPRHIVLVGLMGSGKTSVGSRLAARLERPFVDNDDALERRTGRTARAIARADGLDALHAAEANALLAALADPAPSIIAAAAGAAVEPSVASALADAYVVYLRADPAVLQARVAAARPTDDHRPELDLAALDATRDPVYRSRASLVVDAGQAVDAVVEAVIGAVA